MNAYGNKTENGILHHVLTDLTNTFFTFKMSYGFMVHM
jgi:hypothetical protein